MIAYGKLQTIFVNKVAPRSSNTATARCELIFNILLVTLLALGGLVFIVTLVADTIKEQYQGQPLYILLATNIILVILYWLSRRHFQTWIVISFLAIYLFIGTHALYIHGYVLPDGLLTYVLVILMSGVLLSTRAALIASGVITLCLCLLVYAQMYHITEPDIGEQLKVLDITNVIVYFLFFMTIILVNWLSNREITRSLHRAEQSERALLVERNLLEVKVEKRTKALEQAHVEKLQEMHRFAEFGRLTSSLLHDLANPLTSANLELDHLTGKPPQRSVREVRRCVRAIERYVEAARRQLRNESEITVFDVAQEMQQVQALLQSRVRASGISFKSQLADGIQLCGDAVRFNQIMANLFANAIDAYECVDVTNKYIAVTLRMTAQFIVITVEDRGSGISAKNLPHIFEPFYTSKEINRGTGIGLAITKQSVETDFGGTISVNSIVGNSTCFTLTLPHQH